MANNSHQVRNHILQWNCQGVSTSKEDLLNMIYVHKPLIVALQETFLSNNCMITLPGYIPVVKQGHFNRRYHGGVAIFVHNSCPYRELTVNSEYQVASVRVNINSIQTITVASIYIPGRVGMDVQSLSAVVNALPQPLLLLGDLNAHHGMWGEQAEDARGRVVAQFLNENSLNVLNERVPTHISGTAIDLSIVSPEVATYASHRVMSSVLSSDHFPILVTLDGNQRTELPESYNFKKARWNDYKADKIWYELDSGENEVAETLVETLYSKLWTAAGKWIPKYVNRRFFPKPWWNGECKRAWHTREWHYRRYKSTGDVQHKIEWKKKRALAKQTFRKAKEESWHSYVSTLNERTPSALVWERIRKIKGRPHRQINILQDGNNSFSSTTEIVNKLAATFEEIMSSANYNPEFLPVKISEEANEINFDSDGGEAYNVPFSMYELEEALSRNLDTAVGADNISYRMLKNMPYAGLEYLLKVLNACFTSSFVHERWRHATIIPIAKPGKDHSNPRNYRPISLTSNLCKTLEAMINKRLVEHLENNKLLSNIQCGFRKNRSTIDHLVRFETYLRRELAQNKHTAAVFFDLEKAYDLTWRYGILRDLYGMNVRGYLPKFIAGFLRDRVFQVKTNSAISDTRRQETGVPQGSTLSVTLFAIKINSLARIIPRDVFSSLFVDDVQISFAHHNIDELEGKLQMTINAMVTWANENGFRFSPSKTNTMRFFTRSEPNSQLKLRMNGTEIPRCNTVKFLGLHWDQKLTWSPHIVQLKNSCMKALNLLRSVSSQHWGADQETLLRLYRSMVRSKLDYGSIVYGSASDHLLKSLDTVANEAIRIATGAFKSTPINRLYVLANEPTLEKRRAELTLRYFYKIKSHIMNPAYNSVINSDLRLFFNSRPHIKPPIAVRIQEYLNRYELESGPVLLYRTPTVYSWQMRNAHVDLELSMFAKDTTPKNIMYRAFYSRIHDKYSEHKLIFTDGSKSDAGVGSAAVCGSVVRTASLPFAASIYTAELHAIMISLHIIESSPIDRYLVCSDSLSSLQSISKNGINREHLVQRIRGKIHEEMIRGCDISLMWIPGHCDIPGNETADAAAKKSAERNAEFIPIPHMDWYRAISNAASHVWSTEWRQAGRHLTEIKEKPGKWKVKRDVKSRKDEVIVNRLRLGHTNLTHSYLFDENVQRPMPDCELCHGAAMTVKHVLVECPNLERPRRKYFGNVTELKMNDLIGEEVSLSKVISYLREIKAYDRI